MIIYLYHDEQYRELEVTALRHKKRHGDVAAEGCAAP